MSDEVYATIMGRSLTEAQRKDQQFKIISTALGRLLHPDVACRLPTSPAIADIATDTGQSLEEMAAQYPHAARLNGYDISEDMYPRDASCSP